MNFNFAKNTLSNLSNVFLCLLFAGLPLIINNGYFNISATKSLYFVCISLGYLLISVTFCLLYSIKKIKVTPKLVAMDLLLIVFAITNMVSACLSKYGAEVWLGRDSRLQGAIIILFYVAVYFMLSNTLQKATQGDKYIQFFAISFVMVVLLAILHSFDISLTGIFTHLVIEQRSLFISTIGNINFFSAYVCLCLPVFVVFFINAKSESGNIIWLIVLAFCGVAAVLSSSESFVLGFLAFLIVAPFFFFHSEKLFVRFCMAVTVVLLSAALFYYIYKALPRQIYPPAELMSFLLSPFVLGCLIIVLIVVAVLARFFPKSLKAFRFIYLGVIVISTILVIALVIYANSNGAADQYELFIFNDSWGNYRGRIYRLSFEVLSDFTLKEWMFGIGPESLQYRFSELGINNIDQAHSEYLQLLITTGIFGLATHLGIIAASIYSVIRKLRYNQTACAFFLGLVAYWAQATVNIAQSFTTPFVYVYLAIIGCEYKRTLINM